MHELTITTIALGELWVQRLPDIHDMKTTITSDVANTGGGAADEVGKSRILIDNNVVSIANLNVIIKIQSSQPL